MARRARKKWRVSAEERPVGLDAATFRWQALSVFALGFLLYVNTLGHDFALDDYVVFRDNSYVKEGVAGIGKIMSQDTFRGFLEKEVALSGGRYRPLSLVTFALEQQLWGGPAEEPTFRPERSHGINALLYAITCLALYACLLKLLHALPNRGWIAWLAAMLFAAHPSHTEAVANIKGRDDVLCFLLVLVSFWMLLQATDRAKAWLAGSVAVYFLALFSKESAVTFLAIFPACLYCLRGFRVSQLLKWTAPFLAVAIVFVLIRAVCAGSIGDRVSTDVMLDPFAAMTSTERYATIFLTLFRYLKLMVFPHPLSYDYSYNQIPAVDFLNVEALLSVVLHLALAGWAIWALGHKRAHGILPLYYLATLSIVSNLVFPIGAPMADRFLYMPSVAYCVGIAAWAVGAPPQVAVPRKVSFAVVGLLVVGYSVRTVVRNPVWKSNWTLVSSDVKRAPDSARANASYGEQMLRLYHEDRLANADYLKRAEQSYLKSLEINTRYLDSYVNLGLLYGKQGEHAKAAGCFGKAYELNRSDMRALYDLSVARSKLLEYDRAIAGFRTVIAHQPDNMNARTKLADTLLFAGKYAESATCFEELVETSPNNARFHEQLGRARLKAGAVEASIHAYKAAIELGSNTAGVYSDLGAATFRLVDYDAAEKYLTKALELDDSLQTALNNMAGVFLQTGRPGEAVRLYRKALALNPEYVAAAKNLPNALFERGRNLVAAQKWPESLPFFEEVAQLLPEAVEPHFYLGQCYFHLGRKDEAKRSLKIYDGAKPGEAEVVRLLQLLLP